jgi:hypothetical protein
VLTGGFYNYFGGRRYVGIERFFFRQFGFYVGIVHTTILYIRRRGFRCCLE